MRRRVTVLVIEDDPNLQRFSRDTLRLMDYNVVTESDGATALATAREARPAVILLDLRLPGVSGLEVLGQLKQDAALQTVPIVVFTATADQAERERAFELGAAAYVVKPVSADALATYVERARRAAAAGEA